MFQLPIRPLTSCWISLNKPWAQFTLSSVHRVHSREKGSIGPLFYWGIVTIIQWEKKEKNPTSVFIHLLFYSMYPCITFHVKISIFLSFNLCCILKCIRLSEWEHLKVVIFVTSMNVCRYAPNKKTYQPAKSTTLFFYQKEMLISIFPMPSMLLWWR